MKAGLIPKKLNPKLLFFFSVSFLWIAADGIFSYVSPIFIEESLNDLTLVGVILSLASVAGIVVDIIAGWKFVRKHYYFFFGLGILACLIIYALFSLQMPVLIPLIVIFSGISYELMSFGQESFLGTEIPDEESTKISAMLLTINTIATIIVPLVVAPFIDAGEYQVTFLIFLMLIVLAGVILIGFRPRANKEVKHHRVEAISLLKEIKVWVLLSKETGFVLLLMVLLQMLDSFFWVLGPIFAFSMADQSNLADFFLPIYIFPGLFSGLIATKLASKFRREKVMYVAIVMSGLVLSAFFFFDDIRVILFLNFISSILSYISYLLLESVFAHLVSQLKDDGNLLVGLRGMAADVGYIAGPIVAGIIAQIIGIKSTFVLAGIAIAAIVLVIMMFKPYITKIDRSAIKEVETD